LTIELIVVPVTLVGNLGILIVKLSEAMHLIVLPLAFVVSAIFEIQNSVPILLIVTLIALITPPLRNILFDKFQLEIFAIIIVE
jgi:hypothetical protein